MENIFVEFLPPWVETGIQPAFYDKESGTVLQQTARMYARVNMLIRMFNKLSKNTKDEVERFEGNVNDEIETFERNVNETVADYIERFDTLYNYVHDYFDNLDVQQEINNKLDAMTSDGTLQELINNYLQPNVAWTFNSVSEMKLSENLVDGTFAQTYGFYSYNDGGGAKYKIRTKTNDDTIDEMFLFALADNTLVAELVIEDVLHTKQIGLKGDGTTDETAKLNTFFDKSVSCNKRVVDKGIYLTTGIVYIKGLWRQDSGNNGQKRIVFDDATIYYTGTAGNASVVLYNMFKYYVSGLCIARNSANNYVEIVGCWHLSYYDWDINDLHIDNETANLTGKTYSTTADEYVAGNNIYVKGTLTIGASNSSYNNVISFYNSIFNGTDKSCCVKLLGAYSKQNIQFFSCDLSYATTCIYDVDTAQSGGCSITAIGCYYDSAIKIFANDDKKNVLYTSIATLAAANTNAEKQNVAFVDYNKNAVISNNNPFGNNLPISNVNYAINGDLSYNAGSQSGNYDNVMGEPSSDWGKSYVDNIKSINGKARRLICHHAGNYGITVNGVTAPRADEYCAYIHFEVVSGTFDAIQLTFKGQYMTIPYADVSGKECLLVNNKGHVKVNAGSALNYGLTFQNASQDLTIDIYEVGITAGTTYIPNMPLDSRAKLS